jgi:hypothetical protein
MPDHILAAFLDGQYEAGLRLAAESDILDLTPIGPPPVQRYVARFDCRTLVREVAGHVRPSRGFAVGLHLSSHYLRRVEPETLAAWLFPATVFLPNVRAPFLCLGRIAPGTPLVELLYQVFDIGRGANLTVREDDALDRDACAWARPRLTQFPLDERPLKRPLEFTVQERP